MADAALRRRKRLQLVLGVAAVAAFGVAIAAFALSNDSRPQSGSQTALDTAGSNELGDEATAVEVGGPFPEFRLNEASGETLTNESLKAKPSIVWFTTSYCVPCQVGAAVVSDLDDDLGGDAFDVLVVFVDPNESTAVLKTWRREFANDDWMVALDSDQELTTAVGLRFLDKKFLLDQGGVIENIDFEQADDGYLDLLRQKVGA